MKKVNINKEAVQVLVVEDEVSQREIYSDILADEGYCVDAAENGEEAVRKLQAGRYAVVVTDLKMPGGIDGIGVLKAALAADENAEEKTVVVILTAFGTIDNVVEAMKLGATDYLTKPLNKKELLIKLEKALENRRLVQENRDLHAELESRYRFDKMIGASRAMNEVYRKIGKVLGNDSTVLITGESGTGKELVARAIHFSGSRREGPFVPVNCGAIPGNLIESELFGHERGAFSGATARRIGKFEAAGSGTIFLDEISTLHYDLQAKFLRVLQEKEFQRVGSDKLITVDVRIITASNQDLRKLTDRGAFRNDLFHRLNVINIDLPPLRQRREDIALLVKSFLDKYGRKYDKPGVAMSVEAVEALNLYNWPGNVRELENLIEQLTVLSDSPRLGPSDLPSYIFEDRAAKKDLGESPAPGQAGTSSGKIREFRLPEGGIELAGVEKSLIIEALERSGGRLTGASKLLGISYKTLQYRIRKYGIEAAGMRE
ncbi:MAG: sigma-54 dependent transcriptional regulator [Gemmatimonadota bacterium]|nr:sigma-54 dependent transcriptional regulator [Gemmatimonadota bacterium]